MLSDTKISSPYLLLHLMAKGMVAMVSNAGWGPGTAYDMWHRTCVTSAWNLTIQDTATQVSFDCFVSAGAAWSPSSTSCHTDWQRAEEQKMPLKSYVSSSFHNSKHSPRSLSVSTARQNGHNCNLMSHSNRVCQDKQQIQSKMNSIRPLEVLLPWMHSAVSTIQHYAHLAKQHF